MNNNKKGIIVGGVEYENHAVKSDAVERAIALFFKQFFEVDYDFEKCRNSAGNADIVVFYKSNDKRYRLNIEVKTAAATLKGDNTGFTFCGSRRFIYIPLLPDELFEYVDGHKLYLSPEKLSFLEGFYFSDKTDFIKGLTERPDIVRVGKKTTASYRNEYGYNQKVTALKTFYSNAQSKIVSEKVYNNLLDLCYEKSTCMLDEFLASFENYI